MCVKIIDLFLTAETLNGNGKSNFNYDNTDVVVLMEEEDDHYQKRTVKYIATFFTYNNIVEIKEEHLKSGDYLNGKYFFFKNMIIIDKCSKDNIKEVVNHLIEEGEFEVVFRRLSKT